MEPDATVIDSTVISALITARHTATGAGKRFGIINPTGLDGAELEQGLHDQPAVAVRGAVQGHGRHGDGRLPGEPRLDLCASRVVAGEAEPVPVAVDDHVDEVRIVEGCGGPVQGGVVEGPFGIRRLPGRRASHRSLAPARRSRTSCVAASAAPADSERAALA
ncbi:hypothetical protein [Micromonospora inositola]|uniref:hypothetical protein n=1 Tax=Micromonospora inositola TaxID=47865 RepID=UPI0012FE1590|nr:hypothetical protein [Micromonospora inositola]